jgi:two-component system, response regulator PdtaR
VGSLAFSNSILRNEADFLATQRPPPGAWKRKDAAGSERTPNRDRPLILVVEDDWFVGTDMQRALRDAGYEVPPVAVSADEAVEVARNQAPDLVVMDIRLVGERDGVDAAIEIRRLFDIPCLFVSAYGNGGLRARAQAARPAGWLTKPLSGDLLVAAVNKTLKGE